MLFNGNNLKWIANAFPPVNETVYLVTIFASFILVASALFVFLGKKQSKGSIVDFIIMMLSIVIASPIAWEHHYGFTFALFIVAFYLVYNSKLSHKKLLLTLLTISYLMMSHFLHFIDIQFAQTSLNFLQSYLLFGALILLGILYYLYFKILPKKKYF